MEERSVDLPSECWEIVMNHLHSHHYQFLEPISLVCKTFLSLSSPLLRSLTLSTLTLPFLPTLLRRFHGLKTIVVAEFSGDLNALLSQIAGSNLSLHSLDLSNQKSVPVEGLRQLGSTMKSLKSLKCRNLGRLCDRDLIEISNSLPWLEELDIGYPSFEETMLSEERVTNFGIEEMSRKLRELQKIDVSGNYFISDMSIVALSSNCVFLREIVLHDCCFLTLNGVGFAISNSTNLVSVSVKGLSLHSSLFRSSLQTIENSFTCARALSAIEFSGMVISDALLCSIATAHLPLKKLALSYCQNFTVQGLTSILSAHPFLCELDLSGAFFLTDQVMNDLSGYLSNVTSINLTACSKLTNSTFFVLAKGCSSLTEIKMTRTNVGQEDFVVDLVKNTRIRSLKLCANMHMNDNSLCKFASVCPNLQLLDVSSCDGVTGEGIAGVLRSCREVSHLEVNFCGGVDSIGTDSNLLKLGVLKAAGTGFCDQGLVMVAKTCPWLLHLDLGSCSGVSVKGVKELVNSCKGLREINVKGCPDFDPKFLDWIVFSSRSLRKIILPIGFFPGYNQREFFLSHGCLIHNL